MPAMRAGGGVRNGVATSRKMLPLFMLAGMVLTIGLALGFEHVGGYIPCALCLQQRVPYYLAIPLVGAALIVPLFTSDDRISRLLLLVAAMTMTIGIMLALYHAGVEWRWWAGPSGCAAVAPSSSAGGILDQLKKIPPACDRAAWRDPLIGLSFAGWNVISSAILASIGYRAASLASCRAANGHYPDHPR